jgi:hypothetical protein
MGHLPVRSLSRQFWGPEMPEFGAARVRFECVPYSCLFTVTV